MTATIVIVNYRAYAELRDCLASLARVEPEADVVVIDHDADLRQGGALAAAFPRVSYRPTAANPGFGAGVNSAARQIRGHLLLLNPDCELRTPIVEPLLGGLITKRLPDGFRTPVLVLLRNEIAPLEDEHARARRGQGVCHRAASGAAADDDDVVPVAHCAECRRLA